MSYNCVHSLFHSIHISVQQLETPNIVINVNGLEYLVGYCLIMRGCNEIYDKLKYTKTVPRWFMIKNKSLLIS